MPRDGSGDYSRAVTPPVNGDVASATDFNTELNDIATALSDSINLSGTKAFSANQPMGGFKLTGLAAGTSNGDSVRYEQLTGLPYQASDATLTALAALSWSSGNALLQFTAADTVSLTLAPSVSSISTSQGAAATTPSATFVNTNDSSGVRVLRLEGDRATPANNDNIYGSFYLSNLSGTQTEVARIRCLATDLTAGSEDARIDFLVAINGAMTATLVASGSSLSPNTSDGMALGNTSQMWSDLFLASGGVLNWNNGDVTVTHSSNALAFAGASSGYSFDAGVTVTNPAGASTAAGVFVNSTDNSQNVALDIQSDRATPAANDRVMFNMRVSDSAGNQDIFGRIIVQGLSVTSTSESAAFYLALMSSGTLTERYFLSNTVFSPLTNDQISLGSATLSFSDLFLASGAVVNFNNGGVTLTHDATNDRLVLAAGSLKARPSISTDTGGTLTSASDNCIVDLATAPTINDGVHEAGSIIVLVNNTASSMTITQDTGMTLRLHGTATTGNRTLAARGVATVQIDPASNAEAIITGDVS